MPHIVKRETTMKLYWFHAQAPLRVLALVKHLKLPVEFKEIDLQAGELKSPAYAALNPNRKAPTLVDGDTVIWEAAAIMAYLCNKAGSDMWPSTNPSEQVEVLRWLSWADHHWSPHVGPFYFEHIIKPNLLNMQPDSKVLESKVTELETYATVLDAHLKGRDFAACGRLTIADFQLASMARYWQEAHMPLAKFPNVTRWLENLNRIPAWKDPWPTTEKAAA
jgi:glutathione S-transferase